MQLAECHPSQVGGCLTLFHCKQKRDKGEARAGKGRAWPCQLGQKAASRHPWCLLEPRTIPKARFPPPQFSPRLSFLQPSKQAEILPRASDGLGGGGESPSGGPCDALFLAQECRLFPLLIPGEREVSQQCLLPPSSLATKTVKSQPAKGRVLGPFRKRDEKKGDGRGF